MKISLNHCTTELLGRTSLHDVYHPLTDELIVEAGEEITEEIAQAN